MQKSWLAADIKHNFLPQCALVGFGVPYLKGTKLLTKPLRNRAAEHSSSNHDSGWAAVAGSASRAPTLNEYIRVWWASHDTRGWLQSYRALSDTVSLKTLTPCSRLSLPSCLPSDRQSLFLPSAIRLLYDIICNRSRLLPEEVHIVAMEWCWETCICYLS